MTVKLAKVARLTLGTVKSLRLKWQANTISAMQTRANVMANLPEETLEEIIASQGHGFHFELSVDIIEIPTSLELGETKPLQRTKRLRVSSLLHKPTGRFRTEEDSDGKRDRGDEC